MSRMFAACKWHRQTTETLGIMCTMKMIRSSWNKYSLLIDWVVFNGIKQKQAVMPWTFQMSFWAEDKHIVTTINNK